MPDRETVITHLQIIHTWAFFDERYGWHRCSENCLDVWQWTADAIAMLKEQEAVEPFHRCIGKDFSLIEDSNFDYCPYCGKPITWAKQEGR
jgi:hypothetical protein